MEHNNTAYTSKLEYYKQVRVFTTGEKDTQDYLIPVTRQTDADGNKRNEEYKARAKYVNFPQRTRNSLVGAVFRKDATLVLPSNLEYLEKNADGAGKPLSQVAKNITTNLIEIGRHGIFTDYGDSAKIVTYIAENIPDWEVDSTGNLTLVVLKTGENTEKHLTLSDGQYVIELYEDDILIDMLSPTKADGDTFDEIPFIFCGSTDNSPDVDDMPLWSIVDVTQGHYQNSADYEDILTFLLPTPWMNGITKQFKDEMYPGGFVGFGSGAMIVAPPEGQVGLLQANANQMHSEAMKDKENQLVMLGARLITPGGQAETAEAVKIKFSAENGVLDNLVTNVTSAILKSLAWCAEFMGTTTDEIEYELNREFWDLTISPQQISAEILLLDRGLKAKEDTRHTLRKAGNIRYDRTDEDIDSDVGNEAGGLD